MIKKENENKLIPYEMVHDTVSATHEFIDRILPKNDLYSLRIGAKYLAKGLKDCIDKAAEGWPVIGHHFAFQREYLLCFDCVPVCVEGTSYLLSGLLPDGVERYYDLMNNWGHPFHTCSSQN